MDLPSKNYKVNNNFFLGQHYYNIIMTVLLADVNVSYMEVAVAMQTVF